MKVDEISQFFLKFHRIGIFLRFCSTLMYFSNFQFQFGALKSVPVTTTFWSLFKQNFGLGDAKS